MRDCGSDRGWERLAPADCESEDLIDADPSRVQAAWDSFKSMSPSIGSSPPILTQACMRPCAPDALPLLGRIPNVEAIDGECTQLLGNSLGTDYRSNRF